MASLSSGILRHCAICGVDSREAALLECSKCHSMLYCGKEHQKLDWRSHQPFCNRISDLNQILERASSKLARNRAKEEMNNLLIELRRQKSNDVVLFRQVYPVIRALLQHEAEQVARQPHTLKQQQLQSLLKVFWSRAGGQAFETALASLTTQPLSPATVQALQGAAYCQTKQSDIPRAKAIFSEAAELYGDCGGVRALQRVFEDPFVVLPQVVVTHSLLSFFTLPELCELSRVASVWYSVTNHEQVWGSHLLALQRQVRDSQRLASFHLSFFLAPLVSPHKTSRFLLPAMSNAKLQTAQLYLAAQAGSVAECRACHQHVLFDLQSSRVDGRGAPCWRHPRPLLRDRYSCCRGHVRSTGCQACGHEVRLVLWASHGYYDLNAPVPAFEVM